MLHAGANRTEKFATRAREGAANFAGKRSRSQVASCQYPEILLGNGLREFFVCINDQLFLSISNYFYIFRAFREFLRYLRWILSYLYAFRNSDVNFDRCMQYFSYILECEELNYISRRRKVERKKIILHCVVWDLWVDWEHANFGTPCAYSYNS